MLRFFKSVFLILLIIPLLITALTGCTYTPDVSTVAYRLYSLYPSAPPCSRYYKNASGSPYGHISPEDLFFLYVGARKVIAEWDVIEDFYVILSDTPSSFELHVFRAVSAADVDELEKLLSKRAELIRYHNATEAFYPAFEPDVFVRGRYAVLAVTPDNEAVRLMLKELLGGI